MVTSGRTSNNGYFIVSRNIDYDLDYQIKIVSTGDEFNLGGFQTVRKGCNSCFPVRPKSDYYQALIGYVVNGQLKEGSVIKLND